MRLFDMMVDGGFFNIVGTIFANGKMEKTVLSFSFLREICINFFLHKLLF
jgi:hypothetical protein